MASIETENSGSERYRLCMSKAEITNLHLILNQVEGVAFSVQKTVNEFFEEEKRYKQECKVRRAQEKAEKEKRRQFFLARIPPKPSR